MQGKKNGICPAIPATIYLSRPRLSGTHCRRWWSMGPPWHTRIGTHGMKASGLPLRTRKFQVCWQSDVCRDLRSERRVVSRSPEIGSTINVAVNGTTLGRSRAVIRRRRLGLLIKGEWLPHDNVRPLHDRFDSRTFAEFSVGEFGPCAGKSRSGAKWFPPLSDRQGCPNSGDMVALCPGHYIFTRMASKNFSCA